MKRYLFFVLFCSFIGLGTTLRIVARTIEFETTEVTNADVALSPDGETLIFTTAIRGENKFFVAPILTENRVGFLFTPLFITTFPYTNGEVQPSRQ